jgi:hypothetical protein
MTFVLCVWQVIAVAMIAAGLGLGIKAWQDGVTGGSLLDAHLVIGFLAVAMAVKQATALLFRPKHESALR